MYLTCLYLLGSSKFSRLRAGLLSLSIEDNLYRPANACKMQQNVNTVKPVLSDHSKIGETKVLKTNGSLMKVESTAECSL